MNRFVSQLLLLTAFIALFTACTKNDVSPTDPTEGLTKIATGFATGAATKVEVYATTSTLTSGFQPLWFLLSDSASGKAIDQAKITLMPMMDMGTMKHSAPFENPAGTMATNTLFGGGVFFIMSSMGGTWTLDVMVEQAGKMGKLTLPLTVAEPAQKRMLSFTSAIDNTTKYFVSLVEPSGPKVGINNLEFVVYKKASMMSFPADSSLQIAFVPEMPTMGHSSPNNVNPTHQSKGRYQGKVNFTMTGLWRLQLDFKVGSNMAYRDSLDITF